MSLRKVKEIFQRKLKQIWDVEHITNVVYNEAAGAQMNLNVEPVVRDIYIANAQVEFGSYIKVAAGTTAYTVACVNKAHSTSVPYRRGDLVTNGGNVYIAAVDHGPQAFNASPDTGVWNLVAPATIASIPVTGGAVVCVGKYHNSINVNGFIVDDTSVYSRVE